MSSRAQATRSVADWRRCAVLLVPGPRPAAGQVLHGLVDTDDAPLDVLHVQPPSDNLTASDLKQCHPAHLKGLPVAPGARPAPFGPGRVTVMASQLASIWARPAKARPGCTGCSLR